MNYRIERTAKAEEQIRDIVLYRAEITSSIDSALGLLDQLETGINTLSRFPESGAQPYHAPVTREFLARGFRVLIVDKYLVFYKVDHGQSLVTIYAVVDGRRDYLNLI